MTPDTETLADGFTFPEGPRWHKGTLWFSDVHASEILNLDPATGRVSAVARVPQRPSGLGFMPDGTLLVASKRDRSVYRVAADGGLALHSDVSHIASWHINDMVVDSRGRAYVGNYGDASVPPAPPFPGAIAVIQPDGEASIAAEGLLFANGMVVSGDGSRLIVAETRSHPGRLTSFVIDPDDGSLSSRSTLVTFDEAVLPDGLAIDEQDGVWVASPFSDEVIRVDTDGAITDRVAVSGPYAVALGGADGRELYICTSTTWVPEEAEALRTGAIRRVRVSVPVAPS